MGAQLGPYVIQAPLGQILPQHLVSNPDLKQRFEREAKALAALSHPHICPVFDVGSQDGIDFLVMEYLEGETLADRLARGPLPLEQTIRHAIEIADALDKAHRKRSCTAISSRATSC